MRVSAATYAPVCMMQTDTGARVAFLPSRSHVRVERRWMDTTAEITSLAFKDMPIAERALRSGASEQPRRQTRRPLAQRVIAACEQCGRNHVPKLGDHRFRGFS